MFEQQRHLTSSVDILFTLSLFYALIQFPNLVEWQDYILWIGICLIILNEQVSVRASYEVYNVIIYLLDIMSIVIYIIALAALNDEGYNLIYWAAIGTLWLLYALWDYYMIRFAVDQQARANLRKWGRYMLVSADLNFISLAVVLFTQDKLSDGIEYQIAHLSAQIVAFMLIIWALYLWNRDRFKAVMQIMREMERSR
jgi:hypothetical protein